MSEKKKIVCLYHNDMDGITSALVVKKYFKDDTVEFVKCDYGNEEDIMSKSIDYDKLIMVDFSMSPDNMENLSHLYGNNFFWIDHHITAIEKISKKLIIEGVRSIENAGCMLTWKYFFKDKTPPWAVFLAEDYDMWWFKDGYTKQYGEWFNATIKTPYDLSVVNVFEMDEKKIVDEICSVGNILLQAKQVRIEKSFEDGCDTLFEGHKTRVINTNHDASNVGEYCYKDKGYAIALMWSLRGNKIIIGLRSNSVDVGAIAKKYGGGGHKFASGFTWDDIIEFSELIYEA